MRLFMWSSAPPKLVFNLTVTLKDSKPRDTATGSNATSNASRSRKEEQAKQLAEKKVRNMDISIILFESLSLILRT